MKRFALDIVLSLVATAFSMILLGICCRIFVEFFRFGWRILP